MVFRATTAIRAQSEGVSPMLAQDIARKSLPLSQTYSPMFPRPAPPRGMYERTRGLGRGSCKIFLRTSSAYVPGPGGLRKATQRRIERAQSPRMRKSISWKGGSQVLLGMVSDGRKKIVGCKRISSAYNASDMQFPAEARRLMSTKARVFGG